jgi:hypothetical protein
VWSLVLTFLLRLYRSRLFSLFLPFRSAPDVSFSSTQSYEQTLDTLFRQYQPQGSPAASKEFVESLSRVTLTEDEKDSRCIVCQDSFSAGDEIVELPCEHKYHSACLRPWLAQHNTCPTCRAELPAETSTGPTESLVGNSAALPPTVTQHQNQHDTQPHTQSQHQHVHQQSNPQFLMTPAAVTIHIMPDVNPASAPSNTPPNRHNQNTSSLSTPDGPVYFEEDGIRVREIRCELGQMTHGTCLSSTHISRDEIADDEDSMDVDESGGDEVTEFVTLSCGHSFHQPCLEQNQRITGWQTVNNETRCPSCLQLSRILSKQGRPGESQ